MKRHPLERVVRAHNRDGKGAMQVKSEGHEALRRAGLSIQECAAAFAVLSVAASMVPMPSMKTIAKIRLRMLYETHGLLCIFTLSFWRCARELVRPNSELRPPSLHRVVGFQGD